MSGTFRHVSIVLNGTVLAQLIGLLVLPLLTRLFAPDAFGNYQFFQSLLAVLLVAAALRYEFAVLAAKDGRELDSVVALCLICVAGVAALSGIAMISAPLWLPLAGLERLPFNPLLLPLALVAAGTLQVLTNVLIRHQDFRASARSRVGQALGYAGSASGIGLVAPTPSGLILADVAGRVLAVAYSTFAIGREAARWLAVSRADIGEVAHRFRNYPLFSLPGGLMNTLGSVAPALFIYAYYDAATSGQFALVDRALAVPVGLVVAAVAQVYTAQFAHDLREDRVSATQYWLLARNMALLGVLPVLLLAATGPLLFSIVFGDEWTAAGEFARVLAVMFWSSLIVGPFNMVLVVLERQRVQFAWEAGRLLLILAGLLLVARTDAAPIAAILVHAGVNIGANMVFLFIAGRLIAADARANNAEQG